MKCKACGWNNSNVIEVSWCPTCGDDFNLTSWSGVSVSDEIDTCPDCLVEFLYWQKENHSCHPDI